MELHGRYTFFAEGARGHLTKELKRIFELESESQPQVYGIGLKELWDIDPEQARARPGHPHPGLAARRRLGRRLPLSSGGRPGRLGLRRRARLPQSLALAVRGVPALEAASGDPRVPRGRPPRLLRRAGDQRGRLAVGAEARFPGRRADRLRRGLRQRAPDQGQPHRDEIRHARRRGRLRRDRRRPQPATRSPITSRRSATPGSPRS